MIILNAGLPRSGTILVNAIIRAALATADTPVKGLNVGQMALPATLADCVADPSHHHVVHMHTWDAESQKIFTANRAQFVPFANIRDPRDCVVSQMRLHDFDLEKATGAIGRFSNQVSKFQKETSPVMLR